MSKREPLITGCPEEGCEKFNENIHWEHSKCGSYEQIDEERNVFCGSCGYIGNILEMSFGCIYVHDYFKQKDKENRYYSLISIFMRASSRNISSKSINIQPVPFFIIK